MKKYHPELLNTVPPDYYQKGVQDNLLQKIWHTWKWLTLKKFLLGEKGMILDVGCAGGMITGRIQNEIPGAKIFGVDLYKKAIIYAKKKYPDINFILADAHQLPFRNNVFDMVVAIETLEHLHDPGKAIKEIYRVLKPSGIFIIAQDTDSLGFRVIWWFWTKMKGKVWKGVHISCMKPRELAFLLKQNNFVIKKKIISHLGLEVFFKTVKK